MKPVVLFPLVIGLACCVGTVAVHAQVRAQQPQAYVAGTAPDRRPEPAPKVEAVNVDLQTKRTRLFGVSQPLPGNVERIAEQGNWYSPMFARGMTGRYDLRGLHAAAPR